MEGEERVKRRVTHGRSPPLPFDLKEEGTLTPNNGICIIMHFRGLKAPLGDYIKRGIKDKIQQDYDGRAALL